MNQQSALQQQFPLSTRKIWKKLIERLAALYVLALLIAVVDIIIMYVARGSIDSLITSILWGVILGGMVLLAVITLIYAWYLRVYIRRYYYDGEEHFITIKKGVFAPTEIHVQWLKIQDVYVDQDILDRILGIYDVHIASATASSGIEAHIDGVDHAAAEGLKKFLLNKVSGSGKNSSHTSDNVQTLNQTEAPKVKTINLSEDISSDKYPLLDKWFYISMVLRVLGSIFGPLVIVLWIFGGMSDSSTFQTNLLIWIVMCVVSLVYNIISLFLWRKNYAFKFNTDNIYYRTGVISISEKHMPYSSIQDVTINQGMVDRLFGIASVVIENAAQQTFTSKNGKQVSVFNGVSIEGISLDDAKKITDMLKTTVLGVNTSKHGL